MTLGLFHARAGKIGGMTEREKKSGWAGGLGFVLFVVLLLALYVLSTGPSIWLAQRDWVSGRTLNVLYHPVYLLADKSEWFGLAINWYIHFWSPGP